MAYQAIHFSVGAFKQKYTLVIKIFHPINAVMTRSAIHSISLYVRLDKCSILYPIGMAINTSLNIESLDISQVT